MFQHEDFGGQLVWVLQWYVQVDIQGPEQSLFEEETQEPPTAPATPAFLFSSAWHIKPSSTHKMHQKKPMNSLYALGTSSTACCCYASSPLSPPLCS